MGDKQQPLIYSSDVEIFLEVKVLHPLVMSRSASIPSILVSCPETRLPNTDETSNRYLETIMKVQLSSILQYFKGLRHEKKSAMHGEGVEQKSTVYIGLE